MNRFILALLLVGCRAESPAPAGMPLIDDLGRVVMVPASPQRILSLAPSNTELVFALGAGHRLVGRTDACDFPKESAPVPSVGNLFPPSLERIVLRRPDLVLMIEGSAELREDLAARGLPVLVLQPRDVEGVFADIRLLGRALGLDARPLEAQMRSRLPAPPTAPGPAVLYEIWHDPLTAAGPTTFTGDLLRRAGARNVVPEGIGDWPQISLETVVRARPDVIIASSKESAADILEGRRPGLSQTPAALNRRVYVVPNPDWLVRPGPRLVEGLLWLSGILKG